MIPFKVKEYSNLIGWKHFRLWLKNSVVDQPLNGLNFWQKPKNLKEVLAFFPQRSFIKKTRICQFLTFAILCKISEKSYPPFLTKLITDLPTYWPTDILTYWQKQFHMILSAWSWESKNDNVNIISQMTITNKIWNYK